MSGNVRLDMQLAAAYRLDAELQLQHGPPQPGLTGMRDHAERVRRWWNEGGPQMEHVLEVTIPTERRAVTAVIYMPCRLVRPGPAYVYLHGGGYRMGNARSNDRMLRELAAAWGGIVLSLDYVLAPEHVFPEAVEDTAAAYAWLAENGAAWGIAGDRLAFGGSSAGANIALGAAIHLGPASARFLRAGSLLVGTYGSDLQTESALLYGDAGLMPSREGALGALDQYVPDIGQRTDPRVNCVAADLSYIPPLFLAAAELDIFRDSSRQLAQAMQAQGRPCQLKEYEGMAHLFGGYSRLVEGARRCIADVGAFLSKELPP